MAATAEDMRPLAEFPADRRRGVTTVLTDIDDTLTSDGRLPAATYDAVERLAVAGFAVVPVTGRPAGWCDLIARFWPVAGIVGENGALAYRYCHEERRMVRRYARTPAQRDADHEALARIREAVLAEVPGARVSADQEFRVSDLAIDVAEDVEPLPEQAIRAIVAVFHRFGAQARVSSIHVNGWFGEQDKRSMSRRFLADELGIADPADGRVLFIGDSPNDEPMFAAFPDAVGVANFRRFAEHAEHRPRWLTRASGGAGFVELAEALLAARASCR